MFTNTEPKSLEVVSSPTDQGAPPVQRRRKLTKRQAEVLTFIEGHISRKGYPPNLREIGKYFGIRSTNGVNDHLKLIEKKGYIRRAGFQSRAIAVIKEDGEIAQPPALENVPVEEEARSVVYFAQSLRTLRIKIGFTQRLHERVNQLRGDENAAVVLLHAMPGGPILEAVMHTHFARYRAEGEWFDPTPEFTAELSRLIQEAK